MSSKPCPFCEPRAADQVIGQNASAFAVPDGYPVSPGHTLVIPRRHVADILELSADETVDVLRLVGEVIARLKTERLPDGFNVGVNIGRAAGQTVMHAHVHVIPRFAGDHPRPEGGIRHTIPGKGYY
jgi:diadenosine tetraphosphate (Ap4A) HIT family hydrolase